MTNRTQWEYKTLEFDSKGFSGGLVDLTKLDESFNSAGRDGWELVNVLLPLRHMVQAESGRCI